MAKNYWIGAPLILMCAATAQAADGKLLLSNERMNYTGSYGKLQETSLVSSSDLGATAFSLGATYGKRDFGTGSASAVRFTGTLYHDFGERFFTRTSIAASNSKPVFATREFAQDLNFKPLRNAVLTVGGKYARYFDNREALSWSAGGTYYFGRGLATYRFSSFDVTRLGKSRGHLGTIRIKDGSGAGSTQLWLGSGTSLHDQLQLRVTPEGKYRSAAIQRVQPLNGSLGLNVALGRTWYQTSSGRYNGTSLTVGLTVSELSKLFRNR